MMYVTYIQQTDQLNLLLDKPGSSAATPFPSPIFSTPYFMHFERLIASCNEWNIVAYGLGTIAILSTCIISSYTQERNHRSLFTLHCALQEQTRSLARDAIFKQ